MIDGIRFKVCGLTSLVDAEFADRAGADYLGFILYPKSPRHVTLAQYRAMFERLPTGRRTVAVMVEPTDPELAAAQESGFDAYQIHFRHDHPLERIQLWSRLLSSKKLWLAPKLPPDRDVDPEWLPLAGTFLLDTFHASGFGGSGLTGDWGKFQRHQTNFAQTKWVLAGGLSPENVGEALRASGARCLDVNSGVELAPGIKDHAKIRAFAVAIHRERTRAQQVATPGASS